MTPPHERQTTVRPLPNVRTVQYTAPLGDRPGDVLREIADDVDRNAWVVLGMNFEVEDGCQIVTVTYEPLGQVP